MRPSLLAWRIISKGQMLTLDVRMQAAIAPTRVVGTFTVTFFLVWAASWPKPPQPRGSSKYAQCPILSGLGRELAEISSPGGRSKYVRYPTRSGLGRELVEISEVYSCTCIGNFPHKHAQYRCIVNSADIAIELDPFATGTVDTSSVSRVLHRDNRAWIADVGGVVGDKHQ